MRRFVKVKLFAVAKQIANAECVTVELPEGATVGDLRKTLLVKLPALAGMSSLLRFAVNSEYASDRTPIPTDAEIACIPPVSGG